MAYETALLLKTKHGMSPKPADYYENILQFEFDYELFLEKLNNEEVIDSYSIFQEKIKKEEEEWANKDLVVDPRETWTKWFNRNLEFEEPPMVPRDELPEDHQPHNSVYGRMNSYINGVNPYPPGHKNNPIRRPKRKQNDIEQNQEDSLKSEEMSKSNVEEPMPVVDLDQDNQKNEKNKSEQMDVSTTPIHKDEKIGEIKQSEVF